jgi:purine-binding chemotaxis protein CheW
VPGTPHFIEGVINLRGKICPVVDLRKCLDVAVSGTTDDTRIVVVEVDGEDVGVMVDAVTEVLRISDDCVEPPAPIIATAESNLVEGIANVGDRLILLVSLETALRREDAGDSFAEVEEEAAA